MSLPKNLSNTVYFAFFGSLNKTFKHFSKSTYVLPEDISLILIYSYSGCTQSAKLLGKVHGVVVQASNKDSGSLTNGKETTTKKWIIFA